MFIRVKRAGGHEYLQLAENRWVDGRARQRILATLGRLDRLQASGQVDVLLRSLGRFSDKVQLQEAHARGDMEVLNVRHVGPALVFGRLWKQLQIDRILNGLVASRRFSFEVERAIFSTVLHRLFESGSDRQGLRFLRDVDVPGSDDLELHHLYRAMHWLGENKDEVEERLFAAHRDLFTQLRLVFFDTTSFYFEGEGGDELGQYGHSKDHRPDRRQVVVGALLTQTGRPLSCTVEPGNQADVTALLPVVDRVRERFGLTEVCFVADRGMVSRGVIEALEERGMGYILGMRMRTVKEIREQVLRHPGRYREVADNLRVKEVRIGDRRYIVCHNPSQANKDAEDRATIVEALERKLKGGAKGLVGNRGFRRYLSAETGAMRLDRNKIESEARYDGKWVLRTNTDLPAEEVALQYKQLLDVERLFRSAKGLLETRPIYHRLNTTITGHIFCSFLALLLMHELNERIRQRGEHLEWADILRDLSALEEVQVRHHDTPYILRSPVQGVCGKVWQAAGGAIPPSVRQADSPGAKTAAHRL